MQVYGYGAQEEAGKLNLVVFNREKPNETEIEFKITHCGVCHSDVHSVDNDWGGGSYPCVPGHEVVGEVTSVGSKVKNFKKGDRIGVGCMIDSCRECEKCEDDLENYCQGPLGPTLTYGGAPMSDKIRTYGGYSTHLVVPEDFAIQVPDSLPSEYVGPILCAGITVYSPMKHWGLEKGKVLGVSGIGGLGHMAIKLGKALDAEVIAFTRSEDKVDQISEMGADRVVVTSDEDAMKDVRGKIDLMIDTIPVPHGLDERLPLMKPDSAMVIVGNLEKIPEFKSGPMVFNRISISGSLIGGIKETQEVIDLCAKYEIKPSIKSIKIGDINDTFDELRNGKSSNYRHVIDMDSLHSLGSDKLDGADSIADPVRHE